MGKGENVPEGSGMIRKVSWEATVTGVKFSPSSVVDGYLSVQGIKSAMNANYLELPSQSPWQGGLL
jgi:hypothetical protein